MTEHTEPTGRAVDTLYYDGACPICRAEIDRLAAQRAESLHTIDVHQLGDDELPTNRDDLLRVLHLKRADGVWMRAADANVHAWRDTRWYWLLRCLRWPVIRWIVDRTYAFWANRRYRNLYGRDANE